jgi:hypothetical protein
MTARPWRLALIVALAGCRPPGGVDAGRRDEAVRVTGEVTYLLEDAEVRHAQSPRSFSLPPLMDRHNLKPGQFAKLTFTITTPTITQTERMWVIVSRRLGESYEGALDNQPFSSSALKPGATIRFEPRHVIQILDAPARTPPR